MEGLPFNENDSFGTFALTDVNGDEKIDLIVTGRFENEYFTKVFINEGLIPSLNFSSTRFNLKVKTFPNPASGDKLNVNFDVEHGGESIIRIFGANGHLVTEHQEFTTRGTQTILVDISGLAAGSYFLQVETGNKNGFVELVVQ